MQTAQSGLTSAQGQQTSAANGLTSARQAQTSGEMQDQQSIQNAQSQLTSAQNQYNSTLVANAVKQQAPKPEQLAQAASIGHVGAGPARDRAEERGRHDVARTGRRRGRRGQRPRRPAVGERVGELELGELRVVGVVVGFGSSSGFIQLTDVSLLDVKVGFTETDAPKVHVGQVASITLDALPEPDVHRSRDLARHQLDAGEQRRDLLRQGRRSTPRPTR